MPTAGVVYEWERDVDAPKKWPSQQKEEDVALKAEIERGEKLLELARDWDGEGSAPYSKDTFKRAVAFLTTHSTRGHDLSSIYPPAPKIGPGPDGSIDLHWKQETWELLINIPADDTQMAAFYGDDYGTQKIKGSLDPKTFNLGIVAWLMH